MLVVPNCAASDLVMLSRAAFVAEYKIEYGMAGVTISIAEVFRDIQMREQTVKHLREREPDDEMLTILPPFCR